MAAADDDFESLVSAHNRELMSAHAAESDLNLAFRLQMEEAIAASLSSVPSSSSNSVPVIAPSRESLVVPASEDLSSVLDLQVEELRRYFLEKKDAEQSQYELRRVADDINRCVHDERVAREIEAMNDHDWEEMGDYFGRPMTSGTASSGATGDVVTPPCNLYFKGMVSTVVTNGFYKEIAAIGVAICDPRGELVLKIQKPVRSASRVHIEGMALTEGMNAAISLGIKNIIVFFDYTVLFNQVRGKWAPRQRKVLNMISHIQLLQRKFERFRMYFLPRNSVRFVYRLVRDVIDAQITKGDDVPESSKSSKETCSICLEVTHSLEMFSFDACLHRFCFSCMKQHAEVKLLHGLLPGCPHEGCKIMLSLDNAKKFLTPKLFHIMSQRLKEESIPPAEKLYCPYPRCSALMSLKEIHAPTDSSSKYPTIDINRRKCIKCDRIFCVICKVPWHESMSCATYKRLNPCQPEEARLRNLARQKLWRQCIKCNHMIELSEGCYHMTCRCGYEFCYTCGKEWKDKKATCSCPLWDEVNILHDFSEDEDDDDFNDDDDYDDYESDEEYRYGYPDLMFEPL